MSESLKFDDLSTKQLVEMESEYNQIKNQNLNENEVDKLLETAFKDLRDSLEKKCRETAKEIIADRKKSFAQLEPKNGYSNKAIVFSAFAVAALAYSLNYYLHSRT